MVEFLGQRDWAVVKEVEKVTGCVVTIPPDECKRVLREIGFMESRESIAEAKKLTLAYFRPYARPNERGDAQVWTLSEKWSISL